MALGCAFSLKAQTQKGDQLLGGTIALSANSTTTDYTATTNSTDYKTKSFSIGPTYSFFVANNLDLGISTNLSRSKVQSITFAGQAITPIYQYNTEFNTMIYLRKYFLYKEKIGFRAGPYAQYLYQKTRLEYQPPLTSNNSFQNVHGYSGGLLLDFVYFPIRRLGIASTLGNLSYSHNKIKQQTSEGNNDSLNLSIINSLSLNIFYAFGK